MLSLHSIGWLGTLTLALASGNIVGVHVLSLFLHIGRRHTTASGSLRAAVIPVGPAHQTM